MSVRAEIIESFHLTVRDIARQYTRIPSDASGVLYHYTDRAGIKGILKRGGLRATYRMRMNDTGEFQYAESVIYGALDEVNERQDLPRTAQIVTEDIRLTLNNLLEESIEDSRAYCACLTVSPDHPEQWKSYAEDGKGFAIGFDLLQLLHTQVSRGQSGQTYLDCLPVVYEKRKQCDLVHQLIEAGIRDLQTFMAMHSELPEDLNALRRRVSKEIVNHLFVLIDFIKAPSYSSEREMRLILDPNDGTLKVPRIEHFERGKESIPFIFMDLRNPDTGRLPLAEIKIGPRAAYSEQKVFLEKLFEKLGYGSNNKGWPRITQSLLAAS